MNSRARLLLVEDESTQQLVLQRMLSSFGYEVEIADNGTAALEKIKSGSFPLVLTDWEMPGMDGITLCRLVREANLPSVYILLLTSHNSVADAVEGLRAGANDFVRKPAEETELLARLEAGRRVVMLEQSLRDANAEIQRLSVTDPLLGIFNRRYLHGRLPQEATRARRYGCSLSVIMADLDHFKVINDTHGHRVGDIVLQHAVSVARMALRQSDWMARYGGEEFLFVLPETHAEGAVAVAERMRRLCAENPVVLRNDQIFVTASFGVASLDGVPAGGDDSDGLLKESDKALYASKFAGRNRVSCQQRQRLRSN